MNRILPIAALATLLAGGAAAQTPPEPALPVIAPAHHLEGPALVEALRRGGLVLYVRHAQQGRPAEGSCTGPRLTPAGEAQARRLGEALRSLAIPVGAVKSSPTCRAFETAQLMAAGNVPEVTDDLNPGAMRKVGVLDRPARDFLLAEMPKPNANTVLVAHVQGSANPAERIQLELGEVLVYRPDGQGGSTPVARVRLEGWEGLATGK